MASPHDLINLSDYKTYMSISRNTDDSMLQHLITAVSRAILARINRKSVLPTLFVDIRNKRRERSFFLENWPVTSIISLKINGNIISTSAFSNESSSVADGYLLDSPVEQPPGKPQMISLIDKFYPESIQNIYVTYMAGYQFTETFIVPSTAPYTITLIQPYGAWAKDILVCDQNNRVLLPVMENPGPGQYMIEAGNYVFSAAEAGMTLSVTYGYIPADLALAAMDWVADRAAYQDHIGRSSKSLGGQETVNYLIKSVPDFVQTILQQYTNVVQPC